jgi:hypothetical protein
VARAQIRDFGREVRDACALAVQRILERCDSIRKLRCSDRSAP